ncbi:iron chelate uptake ABC transporter family permease subunit [uncultured Shimia sp.]|uniref:iron chelate uptake ABC transporter family permease subunit n=1 Tax=uncultured Shimia sp. TaxID=573152 RepID=UPI0025FC9B71|nr:iron chelate uptake ABC transporter family permease subunit [uncultured Shimia sp.]
MAAHTSLSNADIRQACLDNPKMRERELANKLGITEAQLLAPHLGKGVTRLSPDLDRLIPAVRRLGEVMALTGNDSCVIEKTGIYEDYRSGPHAALVVNNDIDLRMFPRHWQFAFAVEKPLHNGGLRRSIQVFDAAGDAVIKIFLTEASVAEEWPNLVHDLRLEPQEVPLALSTREPTETAKGDPAKADQLRAKWDKITDTHQFLQMVRRLKINRLGAYRIAGAPYVRLLQTSARHMGISVQTVKRATILCVAAATGAAVAVSGGIGFVGIVVPHVLRLVAGPDQRHLLMNSALLGGVALVLSDVLARTIIAPAELPIGILTAILGGPFFLWILLRQRSILDL